MPNHSYTYTLKVRMEHKYGTPGTEKKRLAKASLLREIVPPGEDQETAKACLNSAMDVMVIALCKTDESLAMEKEDQSEESIVLSAFLQSDYDPKEDNLDVTSHFRKFVEKDKPDTYSLSKDLREHLRNLDERTLRQLVHYTLWNSGPALSWRRTDL